MKLLLCPHCNDVVALQVGKSRSCECGKSHGMYVDNINATVGGIGLLIGLSNSSLAAAIRDHIDRPEGRLGHEFTAFIIPEDAGSVKREGTNTWIPMMRERIEEQKHEEAVRLMAKMTNQSTW